MARQRKLTEERRILINQLLVTYNIEDADGVQSNKFALIPYV